MVNLIRRFAVAVVILSFAAGASQVLGQPNPFPRAVLSEKPVAHWRFNNSVEGWQVQANAKGAKGPTAWLVKCETHDPMLLSPRFEGQGLLQFSVRMRTTGNGPGQVFWFSDRQPNATEERSARFETLSDGKWHTYRVNLPTLVVNRLRFDPIVAAGEAEIDWIEIKAIQLHPLEIVRTETTGRKMRLHLLNHAEDPLSCSADGQEFSLKPKTPFQLSLNAPDTGRAFDVATVEIEIESFPTVERRIVIIDQQADGDWLPLGANSNFMVARDGSGIRLMHGDRIIGSVAPLVWDRDSVAKLNLVSASDEEIAFTGDGVERLSLRADGSDLLFKLDSEKDWEAAVVRVDGNLEQGLLAGVEHLGRNERSSSTIDLRGPEHNRFETNPMNLTMPLMSVVTDRGSVSMLWQNSMAQPVYAVPNFVDGTKDHRMALKGDAGLLRIRVGRPFSDGERLEDVVLWAVAKRGGLPTLPKRPRNPDDQETFVLESLQESEIRADDGRWYHAMIPGVKYLPAKPNYFADMASTMFRLTGDIPEYRPLAPGGSHLRNGSVFFVTGQAAAWLERQKRQAAAMYARQKADGSFRYGGEYRAGHFEDTASGHCARPTVTILQYAKYSGDKQALEIGCKTLEYMKRFRTPRGASVWECPLHAPDLLASALLARAYLLGYELTGNEEYRDLAVRWAVSGVPYVYQWSNRPIMMYATTGTLCATHYKAPVWIGRPVQWMGLVYADVLVDLAEHDKTLDWRRLAQGIMISAEQQQYVDGPSKGCLADSLLLDTQRLLPYDINPCALFMLKRRLEGRPAGVYLTIHKQHRLIAPFPVDVDGDVATIHAAKGLVYEVLKDGKAVRLESQGDDKISLVD